jgi:hypothetical protein
MRAAVENANAKTDEVVAGMEQELGNVASNVNEIWIRVRSIVKGLEDEREAARKDAGTIAERIEELARGEDRLAVRLIEVEQRLGESMRAIETHRDRVFLETLRDLLEQLPRRERKLFRKRMRAIAFTRGEPQQPGPAAASAAGSIAPAQQPVRQQPTQQQPTPEVRRPSTPRPAPPAPAARTAPKPKPKAAKPKPKPKPKPAKAKPAPKPVAKTASGATPKEEAASPPKPDATAPPKPDATTKPKPAPRAKKPPASAPSEANAVVDTHADDDAKAKNASAPDQPAPEASDGEKQP